MLGHLNEVARALSPLPRSKCILQLVKKIKFEFKEETPEVVISSLYSLIQNREITVVTLGI